MVTMDARRIFLDTNILISAIVPDSPRYFHARGVLQRLERSISELWISRQVLREFLSALTRPQVFVKQFPLSALLTAANEYEQVFVVAEDHALVTQQLYFLLDKIPCGGKQVHDANIVATMLAFDIPQLVTYNTEDFSRFSGLIEVVSEV